uniref:Twisted gastrulation n=1 Tax=Timema genevievae TaxID=629358 RepID=A0A7R9JZW6_TIMGE|nr:unnamed protein product [Timema genevievae]
MHRNGMTFVKAVLTALLATTVFLMTPTEGCNEAVCASVVSKCMLTQSCKCDINNYPCYQECYGCLGNLYSDCCSCVDICPKPNNTSTPLGKQSVVEAYPETFPHLFQALMSEPDPQERWTPFTFPVDHDISSYWTKPDREITYHTQTAEQELLPNKNMVTLNCTVAFMSQCMPWNKCKTSCLTTGATSYRWFHDGCCECIGQECINYGIDESRCLNCPENEDELDEEDETSYIYDDSVDLEEEDKLGDIEQTEVMLCVLQSSLMSSDRMKPRSEDWAVRIDFLQESTITSLASGSNSETRERASWPGESGDVQEAVESYSHGEQEFCPHPIQVEVHRMGNWSESPLKHKHL